jgi:hypothetical protein
MKRKTRTKVRTKLVGGKEANGDGRATKVSEEINKNFFWF